MPAVSTVRALLASVRRAIEGPEGPQIAWTLRGYRPEQLSGDVIAGLTVAALIVPLSIGYAGVAGLPPEVGLYASLAPLVAYAIFGSARRLIVGPDASTAALIAATIAPLAVVADDRVRLASALGLLVAVIFVAMRMARLGFLADFLSRPILVGYLTGVGIVVAVGQVEKMLGGPAIAEGVGVLARIEWVGASLTAVAEAVTIAIRGSGASVASVLVAAGVMAAILLGRRFAPRVPMALVAMVVALAVSAALDLQSLGVRVLGPVPAGLPPIGIPVVGPEELLALLPGAVGLALLTFADATVTGRSFAAKRGERTDANRELVALAAADAAGALTGGYPISASPSRTAAAEDAGSSSQATGLVATIAVAVVLVAMTGPLAYLPIPALGAVIFLAVLGLIDIGAMREIWRLKRSEGAIAFVAMTGVIIYGTLVGVAIAVLLAALNIVRRAAWPEIVEEGRLPDGSYRDLHRSPDARRVPGASVLRFTGPIFFANATALGARVREIVAERPDVRVVVLDLGATADIDLTAGRALQEIVNDLGRGERCLVVAQPLGRVRDELRAYGLADLMDPTGGGRGSVDEALIGLGLDPAASLPAEEDGEGEAGPGPGPVPEPPAPEEARNRLVLRLVLIGVAIVAAAAVLAFAVSSWTGAAAPGPATVPNLVGLSLDRAGIAAGNAGFELAAPVYVRRDDRPEGTVVDQDPPAGTLANPGSEIQPLVSTGRQLVLVPDVVGDTEAQAIATLTAAGLTVRRTATVYDPAVPAGTVITTAPAAGTSVAAGTAVSYTVSRGPEPEATPGPTPIATPQPSDAP
jgi:SulP family sulfate permease